MEYQPKTLNEYQIVGFIVSTAILVGFIIIARQDILANITLGLVLAALTQLFGSHSSQEIRGMMHKFDFQK